MRDYRYHVALSFAKEDRQTAEELWQALTEKGLRVFYDKEHQSRLLGADLTQKLADVYDKQSQYCLMLISKNYAQRDWPNFERQIAVARNLSEREYILPLQLDDTQIPSIPKTIGILDGRENITYAEIVDVLVAKLFSPDPINTFEDEEIGSCHLHIDSGDNCDFNSVREALTYRDFSVKEARIRRWIEGPQRVRQTDIYEVHTPEKQKSEVFSQLITAERDAGQVRNEDISHILSLISKYPGTVIEVEKKVFSINQEGKWSGRLTDDDSMLNSFSLPSNSTIAKDLLEVHHQIDIKRNSNSDDEPLSLDDLRQLSVETGLNVGGWFLFERERRWSYRSNSFLPLSTAKHEFLRQYHLFKEVLEQHLHQNNLKASHRMIVERVLGIWKVDALSPQDSFITSDPPSGTAEHLERRKLAEWEQNIADLKDFWVVAPNFLGDRFPEFKRAMHYNLTVRQPPTKYVYFLSSQTDLHRLRKLISELSAEYGEDLGNNFDAFIFWDKPSIPFPLNRNYFIANPLDPNCRDGYTLNTGKKEVIRAKKIFNWNDVETFIQSLLLLLQSESSWQDIYLKKVSASPKIKEEVLSVMRTRLIDNPKNYDMEEWEQRVINYDMIVAEVVSQNNGNVVKATVSLGYIATFPNARLAVECAQELQKELGDSPPHIIALDHGTVSRVWRAQGVDYIGKSIQSVEVLKDFSKVDHEEDARPIVLMSESFRLYWLTEAQRKVVERKTKIFNEDPDIWEFLP